METSIKTEPEILPCASTSSHLDPPEELVPNLEVSLCRLCANIPERSVEIYGSEGTSSQLSDRINEYLPVKVSPHDKLSLCCCGNCVSTLLSFHELVVSCVDAEKRLQIVLTEKPKLIPPAEQASNSAEIDEGAELMDADTEVLNEDDGDEDFEMENEEEDSEEEEAESKPVVAGVSDNTEAMAEWDTASASLNAYSNPALCKKRKSTDDENVYNDSDIKKWESSETVVEMFDSVIKEEIKKSQSAESDTDYKYLCEFCSAVFNSDEAAYAHVKSEHPNKVSAAKKPRKKHLKVDKEMVDKAKVVVDGKVYYNCKTCGKSLHSPYTYLWHMRIHTGERPYVCDLCGKQFRVSQGLVRHLKETHAGIKNYPCDLCGRMFATRRNVEEHRRIHTNERPYVCDLCGKAFKQKASLFVHNRSHTNYFPFRCTYCDQGFRTRPTLLIHVTRHTGEKPHPCEICGRRFRIKYELNRHKLIHSDEKPFKCEECCTAFRQKRYLRNHMRINHNRELKS